MKILKQILKVLAITFLVLVGSFIGLVCLVGYMFSSNEEEVDSTELVQSIEFNRLHQLTVALDSINNIAVLPNKTYIVINGIVINLLKQTFGQEPELGFYQSYYEEGDKIHYTSIDSLLTAHRINIDSLQAFSIIERMKSTKISDIEIHKESITYRWRTSAMYGEEGVIFSNKVINKDSTRFDLLEKLDKGFYHFAVND